MAAPGGIFFSFRGLPGIFYGETAWKNMEFSCLFHPFSHLMYGKHMKHMRMNLPNLPSHQNFERFGTSEPVDWTLTVGLTSSG